MVQLKCIDMNLSRSDQGQMHVNIYFFIVLFFTSSQALLVLVREGFTQAWNPFVHVSDILMHCQHNAQSILKPLNCELQNLELNTFLHLSLDTH